MARGTGVKFAGVTCKNYRGRVQNLHPPDVNFVADISGFSVNSFINYPSVK